MFDKLFLLLALSRLFHGYSSARFYTILIVFWTRFKVWNFKTSRYRQCFLGCPAPVYGLVFKRISACLASKPLEHVDKGNHDHRLQNSFGCFFTKTTAPKIRHDVTKLHVKTSTLSLSTRGYFLDYYPGQLRTKFYELKPCATPTRVYSQLL